MKSSATKKNNKNWNAVRRRRERGCIHFLSLPLEIITIIFNYYLADYYANPVIPLLICKKISNIIINLNFFGFLKNKKYNGDRFCTNAIIAKQANPIRRKYLNSQSYNFDKYFYLEENGDLTQWYLEWYDNLKISFNKPRPKNLRDCYIIYHETLNMKLIESSIQKIISTIEEDIQIHETKYKIYDYIIVIQAFSYGNNNIFVNLCENRYVKNAKTFLRYKKPCKIDERIGKNNGLLDFSGKSFYENSDYVEYNLINRNLSSSFYEQILNYSDIMLRVIGLKLLRNIFDAVLKNLEPHLYINCLTRLIYLHEYLPFKIFNDSLAKFDINWVTIKKYEILKYTEPVLHSSFKLNYGRVKDWQELANEILKSALNLPILACFGSKCPECLKFVKLPIYEKRWTITKISHNCTCSWCYACGKIIKDNVIIGFNICECKNVSIQNKLSECKKNYEFDMKGEVGILHEICKNNMDMFRHFSENDTSDSDDSDDFNYDWNVYN